MFQKSQISPRSLIGQIDRIVQTNLTALTGQIAPTSQTSQVSRISLRNQISLTGPESPTKEIAVTTTAEIKITEGDTTRTVLVRATIVVTGADMRETATDYD